MAEDAKKRKKKDQVAVSEKALAVKQANEGSPPHPTSDDHAHEGMPPKHRAEQPTSGALNAEGHRPVLERSRKVR